MVTPSVWLLLTLSQVFIILERFLSALTRCSMFTLHCPLPSPGISYFSKEFWFLLVGCSIWKAKSGCMMCPLPAGCLVLPGSFTEKANIRVIFSWVDIETFNSNLIPQTSFYSCSFHILTSFSNGNNYTAFMFSLYWIYVLICSVLIVPV